MTSWKCWQVWTAALLICGSAAALADKKDTLDSIRAKKSAASVRAPVVRKTPVASPPRRGRATTGPRRQWLVAQSGGDFKTIQEALKKVPAGARLVVRSGIYTGKLSLDRPVEILAEPDGNGVVVEAAAAPCVMVAADRVRLRGLLFRCLSDAGGAVVDVSRGRTVVEDCAVEGGEGATAAQSALRMRGNSDVTLDRCQITGGAEGIRVIESARCLLRSSDLSGSSSTGIAASDTAILRLYGCNLLNHAGAGMAVSGKAQALLETCEIAGNRTGVLVSGSGPLLRKCRVRNNRQEGFAFRRDSRGELDDCDVLDNGVCGVSISQRSDPTLRNCRIAKSGADNVRVFEAGRGTLERCVVSQAGATGIAILTDADPTLRNCMIGPNRREGVYVENARGLVEASEVYGTTDSACVALVQGANPRFVRCRIRQGQREGLLVDPRSHGVFEDCDLFGHMLANVVVRPGGSPTFRACRVPLFNGTSLAGWEPHGGPWPVTEGTLSNSQGRDGDWIESASSFPAGEISVEVRVKIAAGQRLRITLAEGGGFYFGNEGSIHQVEPYGGEITEVQQVAEDSYSHNIWYTYRVEVDGQGRLRLFRDGVLTHSARWNRAHPIRLRVAPGDNYSDGRVQIAAINLELGGHRGATPPVGRQ